MTTAESQLAVRGQAVTGGSTPSRIRTYDLRIRSPLLYPAELWARERLDRLQVGVAEQPRCGWLV